MSQGKMRTQELAAEMTGIVGDGNVLADPAGLSRYSDGAFRAVPGLTDQWRYMLGDYSDHSPGLVVRPSTTAEVSNVLSVANRERVGVVPWCGATNFVGGDVPTAAEIVIDLTRMDKVLRVDSAGLFATTQPGVTLIDLQEELGKSGLRHGTLPGSAKWVTVGGAIASDAHTLAGFKYGTIAQNLLSLEVVIPTGAVIRTGPPYGAGYDLRDLFARSEGTLGIITEATFRVHRVQPYRLSYGFGFESFSEALLTHEAILGSDIPELSTILTFDRFTKKYPGFAREMGAEREAGTLITLEGRENGVREAERAIAQIVGKAARAVSARVNSTYDDWWTLLAEYVMKTVETGEGMLTSDWKAGPHVWVPKEQVERVREIFVEVVARHGMEYTGVIYTPTRLLLQFLYSHADREACGRAYVNILKEIEPVVHGAGGTMTGAHGAGLLFRNEMEQLNPAGLELMRGLRRTLDPNGIMNRGKLFE